MEKTGLPPKKSTIITIFAARKPKTMKVKLNKQQIEKLAQNPDAKIDIDDPWWIIVLKVTAYLIGLILAGMGTTTTAAAMGMVHMSLPL